MGHEILNLAQLQGIIGLKGFVVQHVSNITNIKKVKNILIEIGLWESIAAVTSTLVIIFVNK